MANYHFHVSCGTRKEQKSAKAKSDYITRTGRYRSDAAEVLYTAHGNMPEWAAKNTDLYWESADKYTAKNGTLFRQAEFSLPIEFNFQQQIYVCHAFADELTKMSVPNDEKSGDDNCLPFSFAIHKGKGHNPHCHLIFSEKINDGHDRSPGLWFKRAVPTFDSQRKYKNQFRALPPETGGARKADIGGQRDWLMDARKMWADVANEFLEKAGYDERIDHRSLVDQGVTDRLPQIHKGPRIAWIEDKAKKKNTEIITARGERIKKRNADNSLLQKLLALEKMGIANTITVPPKKRWEENYLQKYDALKDEAQVHFVFRRTEIRYEIRYGYQMWEWDNAQWLEYDQDDIKIWAMPDEIRLSFPVDNPEKLEKAVTEGLKIAMAKGWDLSGMQISGSDAFQAESRRQIKAILEAQERAELEKTQAATPAGGNFSPERIDRIKRELDPERVLRLVDERWGLPHGTEYDCDFKGGMGRIRPKGGSWIGPNVIDFVKQHTSISFGEVLALLDEALNDQDYEAWEEDALYAPQEPDWISEEGPSHDDDENQGFGMGM